MGRVMVIRTKGGNNRGGTRLTPFAERYIQRFRKLEKKINHYAEREFNQFQTRLQETENKKGGGILNEDNF
jgi:molybdate transport repressor ModE-like protein